MRWDRCALHRKRRASIQLDNGMKWQCVNTEYELKCFYKSIMPRLSLEARKLGYAIGVHGSLHRDLDLIAIPWVDDHSVADELACALQLAACGFKNAAYVWEKKPCGRIATMFPVCWTDCAIDGAGHIDLSVMPSD